VRIALRLDECLSATVGAAVEVRVAGTAAVVVSDDRLGHQASWCSDVEPKMRRLFASLAAQPASVFEVVTCPSLSTASAKVSRSRPGSRQLPTAREEPGDRRSRRIPPAGTGPDRSIGQAEIEIEIGADFSDHVAVLGSGKVGESCREELHSHSCRRDDVIRGEVTARTDGEYRGTTGGDGRPSVLSIGDGSGPAADSDQRHRRTSAAGRDG